jgi:hypothetical protein
MRPIIFHSATYTCSSSGWTFRIIFFVLSDNGGGCLLAQLARMLLLTSAVHCSYVHCAMTIHQVASHSHNTRKCARWSPSALDILVVFSSCRPPVVEFNCRTDTLYATQTWYAVISFRGSQTCFGVCSIPAACHGLLVAIRRSPGASLRSSLKGWFLSTLPTCWFAMLSRTDQGMP